MNYSLFINLIVNIGFCLTLFSCSQTTRKETFPNPEIKAGIAKISGRLINYHWNEKEINPIIRLRTFSPITAEILFFETLLDSDGSFYFEEIPIECNTIGVIYSYIFNQIEVGAGLMSDEETQVKIVYDENNNIIEVQHSKNSLLSSSDNMLYLPELEYKFYTPIEGDGKYYDMKQEEYIHTAMKIIEKRLEYIFDDSHLSKRAENLVTNDFRLRYMIWLLLDNSSYISLNYHNFKTEDEPANFIQQEPHKSYYSFLKDFDLNNPQYLYSYNYFQVLQTILRNQTLNIPPIGNTPIDQWEKEVKVILSKLIGFNEGFFYDMLAANSYAKQFNNEWKPLSDKQKVNISNYFNGKKGEIAKILLRKNEKIIRLTEGKSPLFINEIPNVPKENLIDTIISKYEGNVVVIDFWATWCTPCLEAMKKFTTVKCELKDKNIVYVYITDGSSSRKLWEEKIKGIGGEQYYLSDDEWKYLMKKFKIKAIPTYLIFDTAGKLIHKIIGYPGNEAVKKMIEELL